MKTKRAIITLVAIWCFCVVFNSATASLVTFTYNGSVDSIGAPGYQVPSFNIGDPFQVTFTFESATPDSNPDPTIGNYYALSALSFTIGSYSGYLNPFTPINVGYNYTGQGAPQDYYNIITLSPYIHGPTVGGWSPYQFVFQLQDPTHSAFTSDALPLTPPNPASFVGPDTYMSLTFGGPNNAYSAVLADSITSAPEPSTRIIFGIGFGWFLLQLTSRKQKCRNGEAG